MTNKLTPEEIAKILAESKKLRQSDKYYHPETDDLEDLEPEEKPVPEYIAKSARQWREERDRQRRREGWYDKPTPPWPDEEISRHRGNGAWTEDHEQAYGSGPWMGDNWGEEPKPEEPAPTFKMVDANMWADQPKPERQFLDGRKKLPVPHATLLTGDGGVGKTQLSIQAAIGIVATGTWMGSTIVKGPVIFYSAEETIEDIQYRVTHFCEIEGIDMHDLDRLKVIDLSEVENAALIAGDSRNGTSKRTALLDMMERTIDEVRPVAVFIDNRGLVITGNENDRGIASSAIRTLQLIARKHECAIILLAHPSRSGQGDGTGQSGSTAWFATGRAALNLTRDKEEDEEPGAEQKLKLSTVKANYAAIGDDIHIRWEAGRLICTDPPVRAGADIGRMDKAERVFMKLLRWHADVDIEVSPNSKAGPSYAPNMFAAHQDCEKITPKLFKMAMDNLLHRKSIVIKERGPPSKRVKYLEENLRENTT